METTMDLLNEALSQNTAAFWCRQMDVNRTALAVARARGRLSPTIAGTLARLMGKDMQRWIAIAAIEAEPDSWGKAKIIQKMALQLSNRADPSPIAPIEQQSVHYVKSRRCGKCTYRSRNHHRTTRPNMAGFLLERKSHV